MILLLLAHTSNGQYNGIYTTREGIKSQYKDSVFIVMHFAKGVCKSSAIWVEQFIQTVEKPDFTQLHEKKIKFLIVHGNVSYDFFYRSKNDTALFKEDFRQHTERVWLNILLREKYSFKVGFTAGQGNSPFMRDIYNMNLNFDKQSFTRNVKQQVLKRITDVKWNNPLLKSYDSLLAIREKEMLAIRNRINAPEILQKLIEEKEKNHFRKISASKIKTDTILPEKELFSDADQSIKEAKRKIELPDIKTGSSTVLNDSSFYKYVAKEKKLQQELEDSIKKLRGKKDSLRMQISRELSTVAQRINKSNNYKDLKNIEKKEGVLENRNTGVERFFSNIKQIGIGRTMVDYTELTAQNVMLTGINIEYNPSYYAAMAIGKIDYGFHDFFGRGLKEHKQYLAMGRLGWTSAKNNSVILSVFQGRKNNYPGFIAGDSLQSAVNLFGYSVETIWKKNENTFLSAEIAKSTKNKNSTMPDSAKGNNLFKFSDVSNLGINIKGATLIPETNTRLSGFYRKTGEDFQSFSLFTYQTNQQSWQLRADQSFYKKRINVTGMFRQNDFTNLLTQKTFKTSTVFKTLQLNVRIPKWPVINAGYYPGSQFYVVDRNTIRENAYYILNGSLNYGYNVKGVTMTSSAIYNRYFNQATDSGFVLYKGVNYLLSQTIQLSRLQLMAGYSVNKQTDLHYYTLEAGTEYAFKKILSVGGGIKLNQVKQGEQYLGSYFKLTATLKKWFGMQLSYEKAFLPTIQNTLYPIEIGRVGLYKNF